jgi:hypothetical protein
MASPVSVSQGRCAGGNKEAARSVKSMAFLPIPLGTGLPRGKRPKKRSDPGAFFSQRVSRGFIFAGGPL